MSASKLKVYFPEIPLIIQPKRNRIATDGTVQFITKRNMTKIEIKNLLEKVYGVGVIKVNTMNYQPKYKRDFNRGNIYVKKKAWKKAIVTIDNTYYLDLLSKQDISDLKKATEESNE